RKTGFDHHFVKRWMTKENGSGSLDDAKRAGRPRKLSKSVEQTVERKMRRKRRRSSRVIARELKRQKVCDVSYKTVQRTVHRRGLHAFKQQKTSRLSQAHKRGRLQFAKTNIKRTGVTWCLVTNIRSNNSKEATHDTTLSGPNL